MRPAVRAGSDLRNAGSHRLEHGDDSGLAALKLINDHVVMQRPDCHSARRSVASTPYMHRRAGAARLEVLTPI